MAQKKSVINLIQSSSIQGVKINGVDVLKVYNGVFKQDYSTLRSDSAYFHQKENTFDAFGHVNINQGDTLNIYSDKLNYNGNTKIAILTDNVRMVDKDATLTTNYLTYNTATRIGTYTGGGKLVNKDNVLTSKNGYYFAYSRDSYFRYDVHLTTPDAFIVTDTLRYNSGSRISYFYGPTNIYGKKKGKDNDTLYTENGLYNTVTEQAFFGKKNQYRQGTKTLTGDSLFYDRKKGIGHAVNHIIFNDTEQKMTLKGDIGNYYKAEERTLVTKNAYVVLVTEEKDTTKNDSVNKKAIADTGKNKKPLPDSVKKSPQKIAPPPNTMPVKAPPLKSTGNAKADTSAVKQKKTKGKTLSMGKLPVDTTISKKDTTRIKRDSLYMAADTLETRMLTYKELKDLQEKIRKAHIIDTTIRPPSIVYGKKPVKFIELSPPRWIQDSTIFHRDMMGKPKPKVEPEKKPDNNAAIKKLTRQDSLKLQKSLKPDSVYLTRKVELSDTSRVRILSAFHHVKIFKSDLQAKSDSAFYSTADSTIRMYVNPIVWTQGSQLTADTINLQMRNKKLDNMELFPNAFIVNIEKEDSVHFNQVAGKKMRGFFNDGKLERMFVDGNAETIYFSRDSGKISGLQRSLSSRIRINFKNGKVTNLTFLSKPEHRYGPLNKFTEEDKVLKGFIWKPKERPVSKESIIPSLDKNAQVNNKGKPPAGAKASAKKPPGGKTGKNTAGAKPPGNPQTDIKTAQDSVSQSPALKDSTLKVPVNKVPGIKTDKDTTQKSPDKTKKDSSAVKKP